MRPTTPELIAAIVQALEQRIGPHVQDKWAASALRSAAQLLKHLEIRTQREGRLLSEDNADVRQVLEAILPRIEVLAQLADLTAAVRDALAGARPDSHDIAGLDECNEAYQAAVEQLVRHRDRVRMADGSVEHELRRYLRRRLDREHPLYFPVFTGAPF